MNDEARRKHLLITKLEIWNFHPFHYIAMPLRERVTRITGRAGRGKTSILEALAIGLSATSTTPMRIPESRRMDESIDTTIGVESVNGKRWSRRLPAGGFKTVDGGEADLTIGGPKGRPACYYDAKRAAMASGTWSPCVPDAVRQYYHEDHRPAAPAGSAYEKALCAAGDAARSVRRAEQEQAHPERHSDGWLAVNGLFGAIVQQLDRRGDGPNPLASQGIMLIDEMGLHLTEEQGAQALPELATIFPRLQIIATDRSELPTGGKTRNVDDAHTEVPATR